jgi:hypothetical protein
MKKILSVVASLAILANSLLYPFSYAYAQEETSTPEPTPIAEEIVTPTPEPTIEPSATPEITSTPDVTPTATPTATPEITPTPTPSPWTFEKVELNKEYQNGGVTLTFTKLPDPAGSIKIEEITLSEEQIKQTGSLSDKAYDITSDMKDGSFTYNLSLPIPESSKGKTIEVKFAEELSNIASAEKVDNTLTKTDTSVSVASLDHFTIFVVVSPTQTGGVCVDVTGADPATDKCFNTIQAAIDDPATITGSIINVAAGTYDLASPINVNKAVSIVGDENIPANVVVNAPTGGSISGANSVFVIESNDVTVKGFRIQGALHTGVAQNAGIYVNDQALGFSGLENITIINNEITNNGYGIIAADVRNSTFSYNDVWDQKKFVGKESESGVGIVIYGRKTDATRTYNLTLDHNNVFDNETEGIRVDVESAVGATNFVNDLAIGVTNNTVYNNGSTIVGVDKYVGIKSAGWSKGVTLSGNEIYGHLGTTISPTSGNAGIWIAASKGWVVNNNNIHDNLHGIFFAYSTFDSGSGSHTISNNSIHANTRGISIDDGTEAVANNKNNIYDNNISKTGFAPYNVYNSGSGTFDTTNNWWGSASPSFGSIIFGDVNHNPWYNTDAKTTKTYQVGAGETYTTIQSAIDVAADDDTINVAAGTYTENLTVDKSLTIIGVGDTTIINGAIVSGGNVVVIQDLKITTPGAVNWDNDYYGVRATANNTLTLENVTIDVSSGYPDNDFYGIRMRDDEPSTMAVININNSRIKGYAAIYLRGLHSDGTTIVQTDTVVNVSNSTLTGKTSHSGPSDDFAVIAIDDTTGVNVAFTGTNTVVSEYTNGAQAKQRLIRFINANDVTVTGTPTYTNGANSTVNTDALFISYGSGTNIVNDQIVARWITNTAEFEAALADTATTPIVVGRYETASTPIETTKDNTLKTGVKLIIEDHNLVTIKAGHTLTNNGAITLETGATFTNNGIINGSGTINGEVDNHGTIDMIAPTVPGTPTTAPNPTNSTTQTWSWETASDNGSGLSYYLWAVGALSDTTSSTSFITNLLQGNWTFSVTAYDNAGNSSVAASGSVTVDTTAPTVTSYAVSETVISPNSDGIKDSSSIDVAFSEEVNADINILDNQGVKVRDLYNSAAVTNPDAHTWNGKNNSDEVVTDGVYTIQVIGTDSAENTVTDTSKTITVDTAVPVIMLTGVTPDIEVGGSYTELGATANDGSTVSITGSVNTNVVSSYTITYNATDTAGNPATPVTRAVNVVDTTLPTISLIGSNPTTLEINNNYTDAGYSASDNYDGNLTSSVVMNVTNINKNVVGSYTVTYNVVDANGNPATQITRTVNVVDSIDQAFNGISNDLATAGIASNMGDVTTNNIQSFSGLYFEKSVDGVKKGKITFNSALDLSKTETKTFLQNLGTKMNMAETGIISLDFRDTTSDLSLKGVSATIEFYGLDALGFTADSTSDEVNSKLIAYDDEGNILDKTGLVDDPGTYTPPVGVCEVGGACYIFSVDVNHFTKYKIDEVTQTTPNIDGDATLSGETTQVVLTDETQNVTVDIASGTVDPTIDVSAFVNLVDGKQTGTLPEITINSDVADVVIPDGTEVTGPADWDGVIQAPISGTPAGGNAPAGFSVGGTVISIGSDAGTLFFDTPVTIILPNVTGTVGYRPALSDTWQTITNVCTGTYENPTGAVYPGECAINNGTDTKIVTFHFTSFGNLNSDICANIDGFQSNVPDGMHLDASGKNCVNWGGSGPAPRNDEGVSNSQVAGVSTLASNYQYNQTSNSFSGDQQPTTNEEVLGENTESEKTPVPEVKGTDTSNWNARNIALISFGSALAILALLLLWRKKKTS